MRKNTIVKVATIAVLGAIPIVAAGGAAQAGGAHEDRYVKHAYAQWVERGASSFIPGNVYRAVITADDDLSTAGPDGLDGRIEGWQCPTGVQPPKLFSGDEPDAPATPCRATGVRKVSFTPSATLTFGARLSSAHLQGTAIAYDPTGAQAPTRFPVDLMLKAGELTEKSVSVNRWTEDGVEVTHRTTVINRDATVRGKVGAAGIGDERSDVTFAGISSQQDVFTRR